MPKNTFLIFQGDLKEWTCADQEKLGEVIPEDRKYGYDVKKVIDLLADTDSVLELRDAFARNMVTSFIRMAGKPMGVIANNPRHLGGAIDSDASDKAARFMQLCDAFGIPLLSLCDAPGFMVGPTCEQTAMVRNASRLFVVGAALKTPILTIVLRKAYGLGAMAMAGGSLHESLFTIAWPTGEFGAMGLEGAVKLGFKKELSAVKNEEEKQKLYDTLVHRAYEKGKALRSAAVLEFDEVIDPMDSRKWIINGLESLGSRKKNNRYIDSW